MKRLDLTGQVFGRLTALYPLEERKAGRTYWRCRCICGKEVDVQTALLLHGGTQSCGCLRDKHKKDITGTRFGMLTAVYPTEKRQQNRVVWHCRCDCGGERDVMISTFLSGKVTSCGCQNKNNLEDLTGRRFGKLVVISDTDRRNHTDRYWLCRCDCGTEKEILGRALWQGATQSCGCSHYTNFTGMKRGKLTAIRMTGRIINKSPEYLWQCECGNEILLPVKNWPDAAVTDLISLTRAESAVADDPATTDVNESKDATNDTFTVGNTPGAKLPSTGGPGTTGLYILGSILTLLAAVLLITKKRSDAAGID